MKHVNPTFMVWDLGGTKCAAATVMHDVESNSFLCLNRCNIFLNDTTSLIDLTNRIEHALDIKISELDGVCIGGAGQYDGTELTLASGYPYQMGFAALAKELAWPPFAIVHDYTPILCATFTDYLSCATRMMRLNNAEIDSHGRRIAVGMGTGLGMKDGILLSNGDFWLGTNEIGHIGIPTPPNASLTERKRHDAFTNFLLKDTSYPATFERVLSGPGLTNIFRFLYPSQSPQTPNEISDAIHQNELHELVEMVSWYAGLLVGTLQLAFMPSGGIWLTGGVALKNTLFFQHPAFQKGIYATPAYPLMREKIPLGILMNTDHAFIGGSFYASKKLSTHSNT